jgi:hypothetical protein
MTYTENNPSGFTIEIDGKEADLNAGYIVAMLKSIEIKASKPVTNEEIESLVDAIDILLNIANHPIFVGGWDNDGQWYLDIVRLFDDICEAILKAIAAEQIAIFDAGANDEVTTEEKRKSLTKNGFINGDQIDDARRTQRSIEGRFAEEWARGRGQANTRTSSKIDKETVYVFNTTNNDFLENNETLEEMAILWLEIKQYVVCIVNDESVTFIELITEYDDPMYLQKYSDPETIEMFRSDIKRDTDHEKIIQKIYEASIESIENRSKR